MSDTSLAHQKARLEAWDDSLHFLNAPSHASAVLTLIVSITSSVRDSLNDDPALAAYQIRDVLPELYAHLHDLNRWCYAVIEAGPTDIPPKGARLCLS